MHGAATTHHPQRYLRTITMTMEALLVMEASFDTNQNNKRNAKELVKSIGGIAGSTPATKAVFANDGISGRRPKMAIKRTNKPTVAAGAEPHNV